MYNFTSYIDSFIHGNLMTKHLFYTVNMLLLTVLFGCGDSSIFGNNSSGGGKATGAVILNNMIVKNNIIEVTGKNLKSVTAANLKNSSINESLIILEQTDTTLKLVPSLNLTLIAKGLFDLIFQSAHGAETFTIKFDLGITGNQVGDQLTWDGSKWVASPAGAGSNIDEDRINDLEFKMSLIEVVILSYQKAYYGFTNTQALQVVTDTGLDPIAPSVESSMKSFVLTRYQNSPGGAGGTVQFNLVDNVTTNIVYSSPVWVNADWFMTAGSLPNNGAIGYIKIVNLDVPLVADRSYNVVYNVVGFGRATMVLKFYPE